MRTYLQPGESTMPKGPVALRETGVLRRLAGACAPSWRAPARRSCDSPWRQRPEAPPATSRIVRVGFGSSVLAKVLPMLVAVMVLVGAPKSVEAQHPYQEAPVAVDGAQASDGGGSEATGVGDAGGTFDYTVVSGDYLSKIAARFLGDPHRWPEIVALNRDRYPSLAKNPNLIHPGWRLRIPGGGANRPAANNAATGSGKTGTVVVRDYLNVRSRPWGPVLGRLHGGDKVTIVGRQGDWYKIQWQGQTAFVHANYIGTASRPAGQTPVHEPSANDPQVTTGSGRFGAQPCSPMPSRASSEYGWRIHPTKGTRSFHHGIDLPVYSGTRLNALGDGVVKSVGYESGGGNYVIIKYDNGLESFYCHLRSASVRPGQRVSMGQEVARSDNTGVYTTGAHLHMEIRKNGSSIDPRSVMTLPR